MSFTRNARRLCGQAGLLLGWRPDEFWRATPDELGVALGALHDACGGTDSHVDRKLLADLMELHPDGR